MATLAERGLTTPETFTQGDHWVAYFQEALKREHRTRCADEAVIKLAGRRLPTIIREDGVDPFVLACAVDHLALAWPEIEHIKPNIRFTASYLLEPLWERGGSSTFWRHVWFSRFAETPHEVAYYAQWLTVLETAEDAPRGATGRESMLAEATEHLQRAEKCVRMRIKPQFVLNLVRAMLEVR